MKASNQIAKGGESHNPGRGWFMIVIYHITEGQTYIVQVEVARLETGDWTVHERAQDSKRTRTAVTIADATNKLRRNSVYVDPSYLTPALNVCTKRATSPRLSQPLSVKAAQRICDRNVFVAMNIWAPGTTTRRVLVPQTKKN